MNSIRIDPQGDFESFDTYTLVVAFIISVCCIVALIVLDDSPVDMSANSATLNDPTGDGDGEAIVQE